MGNGEEHFCLRWNDFQESILSTLQDLRSSQDFVDVTLVTPTGEQLRAHKLILSACSDFFRQLLRSNPAPNPVIVLWDMGVNDLRNILRFMYNGEVEVKQTNLNRFLSVAERLRVRGLCQSDGKPSPSQSPKRSDSPKPKATLVETSETNNATTNNAEKISNAVKMASTSSTASSSPGSQRHLQRRRLSSAGAERDFSPNRKRVRNEDGGEISVKPESQLLRSPSPIAAQPFEGADMEDRGEMEDLNRSRLGSEEEEYTEYGYAEGFDEHGPLQSALMAGMAMQPGGMLDPSAAKELWRRATMARISLGSSPTSGNSPPAMGGGPSPGSSEPARRQRSVYTSQQISQLETYFQFNEYIDGDRKKQLSRLTNIPEQQIKVWFQNRRQKKKREVEEHQQIQHHMTYEEQESTSQNVPE